ncbi:MAG: DUF2314 domain-containing protein [Maritimibacter sp.]|nr:DUF2314 domain-containing protein [Maritimibacter sp.]
MTRRPRTAAPSIPAPATVLPSSPNLPRIATLALALILAPLAAPAQTETTAETIRIPQGDPAMAAAIETAQATLPMVFAAVLDADGRAHPAFTLKVAFPVETGEEVIWVSDVVRTPMGFTAALANAPRHLAGLSMGDTVTFQAPMIADWGLSADDGKLYGHYTTRALLATLPADAAERIRALLSEAPLPPGWR